MHASRSLKHFNQVSESDVKRVISKMKTKSCELDILPTFKLKELIEDFQPIITQIVNLSLAEGKFPSDRKNARIRPLIKKMGMDLTAKSY